MNEQIGRLTRIDKPVSTLAIVPKSGSITRIGRQAYSIMMLKAKEMRAEDPETGLFRCPIQDIIRGFEGSKGSLEELKRHLKSMVTHVVESQSPTPGETEEWGACALLSQVSLKKEKGELWVGWAYPPALREELLSPQRFAQIRRETVALFRTYAGLALYEICCRYKDNPSHLTSRQHWRWWLPVLTGKPDQPDRKTQFRFFNRDTLKPAIEEVNEVSELEVAVIEFKRGRSIEDLQFKVRVKPPSWTQTKGDPIEAGKLTRAIELGIASDEAEELFLKFGEIEFGLAVTKLDDRLRQPGIPIRSRVAYLRTILKGLRVEEGHSAHHAVETDTTQDATGQHKNASAHPGEAHQRRVDQVSAQRVKQARAEIADLSESELRSLLNALRESLRPGDLPEGVVRRLENGEWQSGLLLGKVTSFYWKKTRGAELSDMSIEDLLLVKRVEQSNLFE